MKLFIVNYLFFFHVCSYFQFSAAYSKLINFDGITYTFYRNEWRSLYDAKATCHDNGLILAQLKSVKITKFIKKQLLEYKLYVEDPFEMVFWIGLFRTYNNSWIWSDYTYLEKDHLNPNWMVDEPRDVEDERCVGIIAADKTVDDVGYFGKWDNQPCSKLRNFICQSVSTEKINVSNFLEVRTGRKIILSLRNILLIVLSTIGFVFILLLVCCCYKRRKSKSSKNLTKNATGRFCWRKKELSRCKKENRHCQNACRSMNGRNIIIEKSS